MTGAIGRLSQKSDGLSGLENRSNPRPAGFLAILRRRAPRGGAGLRVSRSARRAGRCTGGLGPGAALALLHRKPCHQWALEELAAEVGASRSVLVERFTRFLGEPPLTYLASWRMQLAARLLQTTRKTVIELALDVGYASEAAFNRAFKREFDLPPAQYRKKLAGNAARAAQRSHVLNPSEGIE